MRKDWWYDGGILMMYDAYVGVKVYYKVWIPAFYIADHNY